MSHIPLLKLSQIDAGYHGNLVLKGIDFDVYPNDFVGIIGPNGGGKTTLLKIILGLMQPLRGTVEFPSMPNGVKGIGYLPQISQFDTHFPITVREVVLSGLMSQKKLWQRFTPDDEQNASKLMEMTGILPLAQKPIGETSGGQRQRALLCRALIHAPKLLVLDEPNTYVDKTFEGELYALLQELNQQMAIVLVSHDVGIVSSVVKSIACVNGTLHYHPSPKITPEILKHYNCPVEIVSHGTIPHRVLKTH
ncbi:MAG: ABC transporter ATP-binding protein [Breznakibacter sp.]